MASKLTQNLTEATVLDSANDKVPIFSAASPSELRYMTPANLAPTISDASTTAKGKVELATDAETITGTDTARAITPSNLTAKMDTDGTLAGNSDTRIPSQKAVKTYADRALNTLLTRIPLYAPQGFLINGKISVTDASGITVAIKTLAGTDPSSTDPVYCRIGDTVRTISTALSVSVADGANTMNLGSAELATKEVDLFAKLGYNATDGVVLAFSRYPGGNQYSDWSTTTTNEKYMAVSTRTNAASTDYYEVIGRFAATLSAGAGYTWSVPTYTAANLIQRPIYETRDIDFVPNITNCQTAITYSSQIGKYKVRHNRVTCTYYITVNTVTNNGNELRIPAPFTAKTVSGSYAWWGVGKWLDSGVAHYIMGVLIINGSAYFNQWVYNGGANMSGTPLSATDSHQATIEYEI